ncbi:radical SAM/SPASM family putative metalloenzyme maturase [Geomonas sp. RF6]|uniref:radical SAM/SPASM family putative metalloenzyme maturase n=1 Tax=Geomonas sp. RF6 TaxID=2897342 RepID=UPI001E384934|nr:radical SAM/SPASM family putative metalloenzyme maturase [Geomonas sp. RF6]UFS69208.1 radical SAM/SPASM family putative metalloenzyme maturase [Geomonas sp. RF6]
MYTCSSATLSGPCMETGEALLEYPSRLFVETTTRCNLSCLQCRKQRPDAYRRHDGDLDLSTFKSLEGALSTLDSLVLNGVGEPLLNSHLEQFVKRAKNLMPDGSWVGFRSNGILLTNMRAISLVDAGLDRICLSMEGADVASSGSVRSGNQLMDLEWALKALSSAKSICSRPALDVGVEYVVERDNLEELPAALEWAAARGASFAIVSNLHACADPAAERLPAPGCDEALALYQVWKREAEAQGVEITRYFEILWKYHKTPGERRIIDFVAALKGEAQQRGVTLDLKALFARDSHHQEESRSVLERAQDVARRTGLELKLPENALHRGRGCASVEQGGAFISWDGRMLPCYRVWGDCRTGAFPAAPPMIFGNVLEEDILDIWNSRPFRTYRESALMDDLSAGFASCADEESPAGSECNSCLWSYGVFSWLD